MVFAVATNETAGAGSYAVAGWVFLRLLAAIYFAAFLSLALQVKGLIGREGILPAAEFLQARRRYGWKRFWRIPTLCWINCSDGFLAGLCWGGAFLSVLLGLGFAPLPILVLLWIAYLSLFVVGRIFLSYQWDILLLETGFLAIFAAPAKLLPHFPQEAPPTIIVWMFWWLLFRLMFSSGVVKLRSGDPHWRRLTALTIHYETQPLPTPVAWHVHQLPRSFHRASTAIMFAIELAAPWLIFTNSWLRCCAAGLFLLLMLSIQLTGNYAFFNLQAAALCIFLIDDRTWAPLLTSWFPDFQFISARSETWQPGEWPAAAAALLVLALSVPTMARLFRREINWLRPLGAVFDFLESFYLVNSYGLFSVITTERPEIILEGSRDGVSWEAYEFKWKPGDLRRAPKFVAPHQPRLDWQMWFAALGFAEANPWLNRLLWRIMEGSGPVMQLLRQNPFESSPPRFIRAVLYRYQFTNRRERVSIGTWWKRERRGLYCPIVERQSSELP